MIGDIQRWTTLQIMGLGTAGDPNAGWYAEADHLAALAQARAETRIRQGKSYENGYKSGYEQGQRDKDAEWMALMDEVASPYPEGSLITAAIAKGQRDALAGAVQRVEEMSIHTEAGSSAYAPQIKRQVIAAIKGEPE